jgi:hypothetical protein
MLCGNCIKIDYSIFELQCTKLCSHIKEIVWPPSIDITSVSVLFKLKFDSIIKRFYLRREGMAAEVDALRLVLAKKNQSSSVPMCVRLWSSFHAKMDTCIRDGTGAFCRIEDEEAREDLAILLNAALKKSSPAGFSGSSKTAQAARKQQGVPMFSFFHRLVVQSDVFEVRKTKQFGNGVFALRDVTFDEVQLALPGYL